MGFFSKGTYSSQNLRNEALTIANWEYVKNFKFAFFDTEFFQSKDDDLHLYHV